MDFEVLVYEQMKKTILDVSVHKVPDIFDKLFFINESERNRETAQLALSSLADDIFKKMDEYLYRELNLKSPTIDRREIINTITFYADLSKSIGALLNYDHLVTAVIEDNVYDWRLMILDGIPYINTYGKKMELLYPNKSKELGERHLYRDILLTVIKTNKERKDIKTLSVIQEFLYRIRYLGAISHNNYGSILNFTDVLLTMYVREMFGESLVTSVKREYRLYDV